MKSYNWFKDTEYSDLFIYLIFNEVKLFQKLNTT